MKRSYVFALGYLAGTAGLVLSIAVAASLAYDRRYPLPEPKADQRLRAVKS